MWIRVIGGQPLGGADRVDGSAEDGSVAPGRMEFCRAARQLPRSPGRQPWAPCAAPMLLRSWTVQQFAVTGSHCPPAPQPAEASGAVPSAADSTEPPVRIAAENVEIVNRVMLQSIW